jgi:hypothetical protein
MDFESVSLFRRLQNESNIKETNPWDETFELRSKDQPPEELVDEFTFVASAIAVA